jgi:endonuclease/exonuclease/phosphatase family metal-dependent hydrolase
MRAQPTPLYILGALIASLSLLGCSDKSAPSQDSGPSEDSGPESICPPEQDYADSLNPASFEYDYSCTGEVASTGSVASAEPPSEDCSAGIWPDVDPLTEVCPTFSEASQLDPDSGLSLPLSDPRTLPVEMAVNESGSYIVDPPATFPGRLKIVAWNMLFTKNLDEQITTLTTHPDLKDADVYLLSEVDRCSERNGTRRAARLMAEALGGDYVYAIEFVELNIGRTTGGDTGQAIISRRPMTDAATTCHSQQEEWLTSEDEPRMGQRVALHADVPAGDTTVRVHAVHFESSDVFGEKRVVQTKEVLDEAQLGACDRPQVIAGDFNTWYCAAPELEVLRKSGYEDALRSTGDIEGTHDNGLRLDYVWARGLRVVDGGVARDVTTSDHAPLWVVLETQP